MRYVVLAAAVLGGFGLALWWLGGQLSARADAAFAAGKAECRAKQAEEILRKADEKKEVRKNAERKKAEIWAKPALADDDVQRLFDAGIL